MLQRPPMGIPMPLHDPDVVAWSTLLLESFRRTTGQDLAGVVANHDDVDTALRLYEADAVVLSHGTESDPVLNYANAAALRRWACTWPEFVGMPSRTTAAPAERSARADAFDRMRRTGWADDYSGVRVDRFGRRFEIIGAVLWEIRDPDGRHVGDGATFSTSRNLSAADGNGAY